MSSSKVAESVLPRRRSALTVILLLSSLLAAAVFSAWEPWQDIWRYGWRDEESSHILLVPIVVFWLLWVRKDRLVEIRPQKLWMGALIIGIGWLSMSIGYRYRVQCLWHGGAVSMGLGCIVTVVGGDLLTQFFAVVAALVFLIPVPATGRHLIAVPLQKATAQMTQVVCDVIGISVERSGSLLTINGNNVAVAEACNGMRMVFTLFLVCYTFTFVSPLRPYVRAIVLLLSPVVAIVCNVIRLVPTVYMYGYGSKQAAETFHGVAGWVMLVAGYFMLMGVVRVLKWVDFSVEVPMHAAMAGGGR